MPATSTLRKSVINTLRKSIKENLQKGNYNQLRANVHQLVENNFCELVTDENLLTNDTLEGELLGSSSESNNLRIPNTILYYAIYYEKPEIVQALIDREVALMPLAPIGLLELIARLLRDQPNEKQPLVEIANLLLQTPQYGRYSHRDSISTKDFDQLSRAGVNFGPYMRLDRLKSKILRLEQWPTNQLEDLKPVFPDEKSYFFDASIHFKRFAWHLCMMTITLLSLPFKIIANLFLIPLVDTMEARKALLGDADRHLDLIDIPLFPVLTPIFAIISLYSIIPTLAKTVIPIKNLLFQLVLSATHLVASVLTLTPSLLKFFYDLGHTKIRQANAKKLLNIPNPQAIPRLINELTLPEMREIAQAYFTKHGHDGQQQSWFQSRSSYNLSQTLQRAAIDTGTQGQLREYMAREKNHGKALYCTIFAHLQGSQNPQVEQDQHHAHLNDQ